MKRCWFRTLDGLYRYICFPVCLAVLRTWCVFARLRPLRVGKLTVYGPQRFLDLCATSLERLASLDSDVHQHLTADQNVWVFYDRNRSERFGPPWVVSIDAASAGWQEEGVISRLVYVVFYILAFPRPAMSREERDAALLKHGTVLAQTKTWLQSRGFPEPVVGCFSEQRTM